ncbi:MAG: hypothetical protein KDH96_08515 [Candidatus Riesia sp.]|nr:hypothetical protein [Candidatus Riesia sp.]
MIVIGYEVVDVPSNDEDAGNLVKASLPNHAMVLVEYYGDGDGSSTHVYSTSNYSSSDHKVSHSIQNLAAFPDNGEGGGRYTLTPFARKGSSIFYDGDDLQSGRGSFRVHLFYLPENP